VKASALNPKFDAYISKAQPFAQPILCHLRELVHKACPEVEEEIKWSRPFFLLNGVILGNIAAFKEHCSVGIWGHEMQQILNADGVKFEGAMGTFGRITSLRDLPPDKVLLGYFRQAAGFVASGERTRSYVRPQRVAKTPVEAPAEFAAGLKKNKAAARVWADFSPSCRREYTDWIAEAKRPETRDRRIGQAVEWIAEGKQRNWKYQNC
jgi:uncharacterized protein YdeI (YjbR/CyaY-like superfamily)